jgi:Na+/H+-dicarboxylate symporter
MTLSRKIVIGLASGITCGLFFGEICGGLSIIGNAYIALMQMTVLPYIVLALIVNIGGLTLDTARHLAARAAVVMLALWGIAIAVILLMTQALPEWKTGGFFSTSLLIPPESVDFLSLYIPANPFRSLSENLVPAVVVFCICIGIAFIGITRKESVIEPMRVMLDAMSKVTLAVARLTPYGVFAIAASAAGTITVDEIGRLQAYMIIYISAAFILSFIALPLAVTAVTPFTYREILNSSRGALLTAFAANNYFIVLPLLIENLKELYQSHEMGGEKVDGAIDITLPIGFPFPNIGRLLALVFILSQHRQIAGLGFHSFRRLVCRATARVFPVSNAGSHRSARLFRQGHRRRTLPPESVPPARRSVPPLPSVRDHQRARVIDGPRVIDGRRHASLYLHRNYRGSGHRTSSISTRAKHRCRRCNCAAHCHMHGRDPQLPRLVPFSDGQPGQRDRRHAEDCRSCADSGPR